METQYDFDDIVNRRNTNCGRWDTMDKKYGTTVNDLVAVITYYGLAMVFLIDIFHI